MRGKREMKLRLIAVFLCSWLLSNVSASNNPVIKIENNSMFGIQIFYKTIQEPDKLKTEKLSGDTLKGKHGPRCKIGKLNDICFISIGFMLNTPSFLSKLSVSAIPQFEVIRPKLPPLMLKSLDFVQGYSKKLVGTMLKPLLGEFSNLPLLYIAPFICPALRLFEIYSSRVLVDMVDLCNTAEKDKQVLNFFWFEPTALFGNVPRIFWGSSTEYVYKFRKFIQALPKTTTSKANSIYQSLSNISTQNIWGQMFPDWDKGFFERADRDWREMFDE